MDLPQGLVPHPPLLASRAPTRQGAAAGREFRNPSYARDVWALREGGPGTDLSKPGGEGTPPARPEKGKLGCLSAGGGETDPGCPDPSEPAGLS